MIPKIGDKIVLKPLHICKDIANDDHLDIQFNPYGKMDYIWSQYQPVTLLRHHDTLNGFYIKENENWLFSYKWIDHIIHDNHFPDDNLFTLED